MIARSHKIRLDPTMKQKIYFIRACGIARFAWNWALAKWNELYKDKKKTTALELKKEFNSLKTKEFPWTYEVTKYASQQPFIHLDRAFKNFFQKRASYPKFKKKGMNDSFYIGGDQLKVKEKKVKIPNLGWVRLRESLRFEGKINGATVSQRAGYWFISINVETNQRPKVCENQAKVGVDLGIKNLATFSDGKIISNNQPLNKNLRKLRRLQRQHAKKIKGSQNSKKSRRNIANCHYKIACKRSDSIHKLTTHLTEKYRSIIIEDLDISDMVKQKKLARNIMDGAWYEFRRQLCYKAELRNNQVFIANRWYASSKRCSSCGQYKIELLLSERTYKCLQCGNAIDRDLNAAKCLEQLLDTVSSIGINACGQGGSVIMLQTLLQPAWQKQELSNV